MRHFLESTKGAQKKGMYKGCPQGDWISGREEAQQPTSSVSKTLTSHRGGNFICQTETEKRKQPTSLQSVCCHQEKWRRVRSHTDKKDVTARWDVEMRLCSPVLQLRSSSQPQLRHCCLISGVNIWGELVQQQKNIFHLVFIFSPFFCVQKLLFEAGNDVMFLCRCAATDHRNFPLIILSVTVCFPSRLSFAVVIALDCPLWWMWLWLGRCEKP